MDVKVPGDLIYVLGETRDELGGSEYYDLYGHVGLKVPRLNVEIRKKTITPPCNRPSARAWFPRPTGFIGADWESI